jgi:hypothetical protein
VDVTAIFGEFDYSMLIPGGLPILPECGNIAPGHPA